MDPVEVVGPGDEGAVVGEMISGCNTLNALPGGVMPVNEGASTGCISVSINDPRHDPMRVG